MEVWRCEQHEEVKDGGNQGGTDGEEVRDGGNRGGPDDNRDTNPGELRSTRCRECQGAISRGAPRVQCGGCACSFHIKCVGNTREERNRVRAVEGWRCGVCRDAEVAQQVPQQGTQLPEIKMDTNIRPVTRFLQWNADGVLNSWYELELFLEEEEIDVCCVQETKLRPTDRVRRMKNYVVVRKDRMVEGGARGGGLLILIRSTITYRKCSSEMLVKNPGMECLSVQLPTKDGTPLKVTNIYIPPSTSPVF